MPLNAALEEFIRSILTDRPVAYHPLLAKALGGATPALFLSQLLYWMPRATEEDGWIWKTQADWWEETGLIRSEQETARRVLRSLGILEEARRGIPARLYYRIAWEVLLQALHTCLQDPANRYGQTARQERPNLQSLPYAETTAETTAERDSPDGAEVPSLARPHASSNIRQVTALSAEARQRLVDRFGAALGGEAGIGERIEEALAHSAASKYKNTEAYLRNWLRREAEGRRDAAALQRGRNGGGRPGPDRSGQGGSSLAGDDFYPPGWRQSVGRVP